MWVGRMCARYMYIYVPFIEIFENYYGPPGLPGFVIRPPKDMIMTFLEGAQFQ